jgi:hypothetical protein
MRTEVAPRLEQRHTDLAAFAVVVGFVFHEIRVGVAGRNRPAEMGGEGRIASEDREETSSRLLMWLRSL